MKITEKTEKERLYKIFADLPANQLVIVSGIIDEVARMRVQLEKLHETVDREGLTVLFQQSERVAPYRKASAEADMLLRLQKNYSTYIKQLLELCPPSERRSKLTALMHDDE